MSTTKRRKYAKCLSAGSYVKKGGYYEVVEEDSDSYTIIDCDGDKNNYGKDRFDPAQEVQFVLGDYISPIQESYSLYNISSRHIYKAQGIKIHESNGAQATIKTDSGAWQDIHISHFRVVPVPVLEKGDVALCQFNNKYGSSDTVDLTLGKTYNVEDTRISSTGVEELRVANDTGTSYWYSAVRFIKGKTLPTTKTKKSAKAHKETITMTTTTTKGTNRLMDRLGAFGQVDNVAMTMTGKLAFLGEDGNYYSYENGVLVNNEDMVIDAIPGFAMPVPRTSIKTGDLIIQKDGTYVFADVKGDYINERGEIVSTVETKHVMFGNNLDFVSKIMDFGGLAGNGAMTEGSNMFANPMMMAMMMNKDGDSDDMFKMMMIGQMMNGQQATSDNPMANMMLPMMMMGKDSSGKGNDMMRNMFMMQMFNNQQKVDK